MKRAFLTLLLLCPAILAGGGCRPSRPPIARLGLDSVILTFGDSLTSGVEADRRTSYPAILQGLLGCKVINALFSLFPTLVEDRFPGAQAS